MRVINSENNVDAIEKSYVLGINETYKLRRCLVHQMFQKLIPLWQDGEITFEWSHEIGLMDKIRHSRLSYGVKELYSGKRSISSYLKRRLLRCHVYNKYRAVFAKHKKKDAFEKRLEPEFIAQICACALKQGLDNPHNDLVCFVDQSKVQVKYQHDGKKYLLPNSQQETIKLVNTLAQSYTNLRRITSANTGEANNSSTRTTTPFSRDAQVMVTISQAGGDDTCVQGVKSISELMDGMIDDHVVNGIRRFTCVLHVGAGMLQEIYEMKSKGLIKAHWKIFAMELNVYDENVCSIADDYFQAEFGCDCAHHLAERVARCWPHHWPKSGDFVLYTTALCSETFNNLLNIQVRLLLAMPAFQRFRMKYVSGFTEAIRHFTLNKENIISNAIRVKTTGGTGFSYVQIPWKDVLEEKEAWSRIRAQMLVDARGIVEYRVLQGILRSDSLRRGTGWFPDGTFYGIKDSLLTRALNPFEPDSLKVFMTKLISIFKWAWSNDEAKMFNALKKDLEANQKKTTQLGMIISYMTDSTQYETKFHAAEQEKDRIYAEKARAVAAASRKRKSIVPQGNRQQPIARTEEVVFNFDALRREIKSIEFDAKSQSSAASLRRDYLLEELLPRSRSSDNRAVWIVIGMHEIITPVEVLMKDFNPDVQCSPVLDTIRLAKCRRINENKVWRIISNEHDATHRYTDSCVRCNVKNQGQMFGVAKEFMRAKNIEVVLVDYNRMPAGYLGNIICNERSVIQLGDIAIAMRKKKGKVFIPWVTLVPGHLTQFQKSLGEATCSLFTFEIITLRDHPLYQSDSYLDEMYVNHGGAQHGNIPVLCMTRNNVDAI